MAESPDFLAAYRSLISGGPGGRPVQLPLLTGSMVPTLYPGDCLEVVPCSGTQVHNGDVAVFLRDGRLTAHRVLFVWGWGGRWLVEKGDLNPDGSVIPASWVVGRVRGFARGGRFFPYPRTLDAATWRQRWNWLLRLAAGSYYFRWKRHYAGI